MILIAEWRITHQMATSKGHVLRICKANGANLEEHRQLSTNLHITKKLKFTKKKW